MIKFRTHIQEIHYTIQLSVLFRTMPLPTRHSELGLALRDKRALKQYVVKLPTVCERSFVTAHKQKIYF